MEFRKWSFGDSYRNVLDYASVAQDTAACRARYPDFPQLATLDYCDALAPYEQKYWDEAIEKLGRVVQSNADSATLFEARVYLSNAWISNAKVLADAGKTSQSQQSLEQGTAQMQATRATIKEWVSSHSGQDSQLFSFMDFLIFQSFQLENNFSALAAEAQAALARPDNTQDQIATAQFWLGYAKMNIAPHDLQGANAAFLAARAAAAQSVDAHISPAIHAWLITLARTQGDAAAAQTYLDQLKTMPDSQIKRDYLPSDGSVLNKQ